VQGGAPAEYRPSRVEGHTLSPIDLIARIALGPPKNRQIGRVLDPSWTLNGKLKSLGLGQLIVPPGVFTAATV
jgi:hypothetical protein